ncbi:MAG: ribokinase [Chloroflexi bacterium]|nr:ribokinase [Chloroflexota bacterium]
MTTIFVVGSYVEALTIRVPRLPALGESLVGDGLDIGPGGKGSNQAIAAARLGADVRLLACVGDDVFGERALRLYADEGLHTAHVHRIAGAHSGVGFVNVLPSGDNWITVDMGANLRLTPQHVADCAALIDKSDILMAQFETPAATVAAALALAKESGVMTLLNPAPARAADPEMLANVDILTPNASEARLLLGLPPDAAVAESELARRLLDYGVGKVVITQGERGALIVDAGGATQIPAVPVQAVDVTGAGDSFNAALAVSLGEGLSLLDAARVGARAGAFAATRLGVIAGLPTRAQLDRFPDADAGATT